MSPGMAFAPVLQLPAPWRMSTNHVKRFTFVITRAWSFLFMMVGARGWATGSATVHQLELMGTVNTYTP